MVDDRTDSEGGGSDELIERVAATLREPVAVDSHFDERVMSEVRSVGVTPIGAAKGRASSGRFAWIVRPRNVRISPLIGLAAAAAISAITVIAPQVMNRVAPPSATDGVPVAAVPPARAILASNAPDAARPVQFVLVEPGATSVSLVGSFNDWDTSATRLRRGEGGVWSAEIPLSAGRYTYSFVVDGKRWLADPVAPRSVDDDFGTPSSVLTVGSATLPR